MSSRIANREQARVREAPRTVHATRTGTRGDANKRALCGPWRCAGEKRDPPVRTRTCRHTVTRGRGFTVKVSISNAESELGECNQPVLMPTQRLPTPANLDSSFLSRLFPSSSPLCVNIVNEVNGPVSVSAKCNKREVSFRCARTEGHRPPDIQPDFVLRYRPLFSSALVPMNNPGDNFVSSLLNAVN